MFYKLPAKYDVCYLSLAIMKIKLYTYTLYYNLLGHVQTVEAVGLWMTEELK